ncbi:MAG TPA: aldolase/citrate lyase family protein [Burkholderiales bacterium]|nr:aldolase/citrate lyase family protein [Burkholderiales bacterium]
MTVRSVRRSGLTMPIVTPRFVDNAWRRGCDFIVLDLEDSVPQHLKAHARTLVKDAIPNVSKGGAEAFVRINHDTMEEDVEAVVWPGLKRIKYPKTEHAHEVRRLDELITRYEKERGIAPGTVEIDASIETALGVANVYEIASASPRIREFGATTGGYDLSRDLGIEMFVDFDQFEYPRGESELAARALGLRVRSAPFIANTTGSVSDGNRALRVAEAARKCGIRLGGGGLNPAVVESHNVGFVPTQEEIDDARHVLESYATLEARGEAWAESEGRVIDRYEAERARELIDWAAACDARNREKAEAVSRHSRAGGNPDANPHPREGGNPATSDSTGSPPARG